MIKYPKCSEEVDKALKNCYSSSTSSLKIYYLDDPFKYGPIPFCMEDISTNIKYFLHKEKWYKEDLFKALLDNPNLEVLS